MTDIVYVLGNGSPWLNNEIRYSLRSVEKHLTNYGRVYIVGVLPEFLTGVHHIPFDDINICKETNICNKILRACDEESIGNPFLFFNDDHFLNADFDADTFPYFYKSDMAMPLQVLHQHNIYRQSVLRTARYLYDNNLPTKYFDTHTPILYDKDKFKSIMRAQDWTNRFGHVIKSLYCNSLHIEGILAPDCKINYEDTKDNYLKLISTRQIWSIGNLALCAGMTDTLQHLYPTASKWEKQ